MKKMKITNKEDVFLFLKYQKEFNDISLFVMLR